MPEVMKQTTRRRSGSHRIGLVVAALFLSACSSPSLGVSTGAATPGASLQASVEQPMRGERFALKGSTASDGPSTLWLEERRGQTWQRTAQHVRSANSGRFTFPDLTLDESTTYRVITVDERIVIGPLTVTPWVKQQTAALNTLPTIGGDVSSSVSSPQRAQAYVVGAFSPARPGRDVSFERRENGRWVVVDTVAQDDAGVARLVTTSSASRGTWRAVAKERNGVAAKSTGAVTPRPWAATLAANFDGKDPAGQWQNRAPRTWRPTRTCAYTDKSGVSRVDGTLRLTSEPVRSVPRNMQGNAPSENAVNAICRDATGQARQYRGASLIATNTDGSRFEFTYGVAAARVKFSPHPGQHAAFWLQANQPDGTEVDTIESFGRGTTRPAVGIYYSRGGKKRYSEHVKISGAYPTGPDDDWYGRFHIFAVTWTPDYYSFTIDGKEVQRTSRGTRDNPHFVVLSNITADWEIQRNTGAPAAMEVDWVRVWQQNASRTDTPNGTTGSGKTAPASPTE